jgi:hypothetical protein
VPQSAAATVFDLWVLAMLTAVPTVTARMTAPASASVEAGVILGKRMRAPSWRARQAQSSHEDQSKKYLRGKAMLVIVLVHKEIIIIPRVDDFERGSEATAV